MCARFVLAVDLGAAIFLGFDYLEILSKTKRVKSQSNGVATPNKE
jgi:hypothetical protein